MRKVLRHALGYAKGWRIGQRTSPEDGPRRVTSPRVQRGNDGPIGHFDAALGWLRSFCSLRFPSARCALDPGVSACACTSVP